MTLESLVGCEGVPLRTLWYQRRTVLRKPYGFELDGTRYIYHKPFAHWREMVLHIGIERGEVEDAVHLKLMM
jgi:hypothetical protein